MTFRNRPTLGRGHRPRWQDELRTQQLVVAGFAVTIAIALGIFAATTYSTYYDNHLREIALVAGSGFDRDDLTKRESAIVAEIESEGQDISASGGGAQDSAVQQQIQVLQQQLQDAPATATESLVSGAVMRSEAGRLGIAIPDSAIDAEVANRMTLPKRIQLSFITANALPADAAAGATPTPAQFSDAQKRAQAILTQLKGGADFATLAKTKSDDATTKPLGGLIGWVGSADTSYSVYFTAAAKAKAGDLLGPIKSETGYAVVKVDKVRAATENATLKKLLAAAHVSDAEYRAYIREVLLRSKFRAYFGSSVLARYVAQKHVAQIEITADQGTPLPEQRIRHVLAQPLPGAQDQSTATPAQWQAALVRAQALRAELAAPGADWSKVALKSDDTGTANQGGDLGWSNPTTSGFDAAFQTAVNRLKVGELSQPVKSSFGYHIIQVTMTRIGSKDEVDRVLAALKKDPNQFAALAKSDSVDYATRDSGGDIGWVARYEKEPAVEKAIFGLTKAGQVSAAVTATDPATQKPAIFIFKLLETSDLRYLPDDRRTTIQSVGFNRWLDGLKTEAGVWIDPQFESTPSTTG